ncbi:hypothetical protein [Streptomyces noursei]|uniref:hypothetical protein n=1 Tax=Streptomyces noursei TaxID=1971 RepID=UPI00382CB31F
MEQHEFSGPARSRRSTKRPTGHARQDAERIVCVQDGHAYTFSGAQLPVFVNAKAGRFAELVRHGFGNGAARLRRLHTYRQRIHAQLQALLECHCVSDGPQPVRALLHVLLLALRSKPRRPGKLRPHINLNATEQHQDAKLERLLALGTRPVDVGLQALMRLPWLRAGACGHREPSRPDAPQQIVTELSELSVLGGDGAIGVAAFTPYSRSSPTL